MIPQRQLRVDVNVGDCFRACMCSILEIPNDDRLPNVDDPMWMFRWNDLLEPYGIRLEWDRDRIWRDGYWIASVPSKNMSAPTTHAIVMKDSKVAHDPSPNRRYHKGYRMLGAGLVCGGYYLVVDDPARLRRIKVLP